MDPEFPVEGDANPPEGAPKYDFAKFSEKLHEIEKILSLGGRTPLDPPLPTHCLIIFINILVWQRYSIMAADIKFTQDNTIS